MANCYQSEVPKSRINITLDVTNEGAVKKKELPLKLLVIGDFGGDPDRSREAKFQHYEVSKENLNQLIAMIQPKIQCEVKNKLSRKEGQLNINFEINHYHDFHPDTLIKKVPEMAKAFAMRNLLHELKASLADNREVRKKLAEVIRDKDRMRCLYSELKKVAPYDMEVS